MVQATPALGRCPYCGQPIGNEEREHIHRIEEQKRGDLRVQVEAEFSARTAELEVAAREAEERAEKLEAGVEAKVSEQVQTRTAALETAAREAEERTQHLQQDLQSKVSEQVAKLQEEVEAKVSEQVQTRTAALETAAREAEERAQKLQEEVAAEFAARAAVLEAGRREAEDAAEKLREELGSKVATQVEAEKKAIEEQVRGEVLVKDKKLESLTKKIEELQKQAEGKTAWELGMQQDELVQLLNLEFPRDRVSRVQGKSGADVVHDVHQDGHNCGTIVYESKNAQGWANDWIAKLHKDKTDSGATLAVLVSIAFPATQHDFCMVDGIPVVHPRLLTALVHVLRRGLIDLESQALSFQERGSKLEDLAIFLGSPDFRNKMQSVIRAADKLEALQLKERKALEGIWKDQSLQFRMIRSGATDVDTEVRAIMVRSGGSA